MSTTSTLLSQDTAERVFKTLDSGPIALVEYVDTSFLVEYDVFAPDPRGRTREFDPPGLSQGLLYCYSKGIYGPRPITRELQDEAVWRQCEFDRGPSRDPIERFLSDLNLVAGDVFARLVEQAAARGLLAPSPIYRIDTTDVRALARDPDAQSNYDATAEEFYSSLQKCLLVLGWSWRKSTDSDRFNCLGE